MATDLAGFGVGPAALQDPRHVSAKVPSLVARAGWRRWYRAAVDAAIVRLGDAEVAAKTRPASPDAAAAPDVEGAAVQMEETART